MKNILIFGSTSAMAVEVSRILAPRGLSFYLAARAEDKLDAIKQDLLIRGATKVGVTLFDSQDFASHAQIIEEAERELGPLDLVLIAHGSLSDQKRCEKDFPYAQSEYNTNFLSVVSILTHVANLMERRGRGVIAVISSVAGDRGRQSNYYYGSSKAALSSFLQGLRNRLFPSNVHVVTIKPGFVDTPMTAEVKKGPLFVSAKVAAEGIVRAIDRKVDVAYVPRFWRGIMLIIKHIPEGIFKRMKL